MEFLSNEWIAALDGALRTHVGSSRSDASEGDAVVIEQHVTRPDGSEVVYHLVLGPDPHVSVGPGPDAAVRFTTDEATAAGVARGELPAQRAFIEGRLRVGGDVSKLLSYRERLGALDDVFALVRARTRW